MNQYFSTNLFRILNVSIALALVFVVPNSASAVTTTTTKSKVTALPKIEVAGWIPYWRTATGTADALVHIDAFTEISPFGFTVQKNGMLHDPMSMENEHWQTLIKAAQKKKIKVLPTVMMSDGDTIHAILSNPKTRAVHIESIVSTMDAYGVDGVDIDYEGKKAETKKYYSLFLKELYKAMGKKFVSCTIEARTPLESRYDNIPKDIEYANDFVQINKYCDRVRIMAYDQGAIDLRLNEEALGPYIPVADTKWVEKVVKLTAKTISKKKIVIGVATYGYEYRVTPLTSGYNYKLLWTFNPRYATDLARDLNIPIQRNSAGEASFIYTPTSTPISVLQNANPHSNSVTSVNTDTTVISNVATSTASKIQFNIVWWSDAQAIKEKVALARKLGVRGVAVFKIDGGEDPEIWKVLK